MKALVTGANGGRCGSPGQVAYRGLKAGLLGMAKNLAAENVCSA